MTEKKIDLDPRFRIVCGTCGYEGGLFDGGTKCPTTGCKALLGPDPFPPPVHINWGFCPRCKMSRSLTPDGHFICACAGYGGD